MQEELDSLNKIKKELDSIHDIKELNKFVNRNTKVLGIKKQGNKTLDASEKYKVFDLGDGFTLYVGKNAANNDELTMKFAKANDLWFHVRGISGSHAVIRIEKGQKPGKHIIEKAAAITAYYSKMRNAGLTPVAYTEKKYVRKPKGANPGQVLITKEKVVQVVPALPDGYTE
jgi:predicted ribosome quality control (RQC) complex YloA/Tae2 family protein